MNCLHIYLQIDDKFRHVYKYTCLLCLSDHGNPELGVASSMQDTRKERDALKAKLLQLTAEYDVELRKRQTEVIDTKAERDTAIQQQAISDNKMKQLEK